MLMGENSSVKKGGAAEAIVAEQLKKTGYAIVECNYHSRCGEIDIIARDGDVLVFVEVKYRGSCKYGTPSEAVTIKKQTRIVKTAEDYLYKKGLFDTPVRFDVAEVYGNGRITIIEDAFEPGAPTGGFN